MDTVGNNIANVNTVGFKSSTTVFEDTLSQVLRNGSAPTATAGGTNPAQVGLGVKVAEITTNFSQGSTQSTGRSSDFMISGDGFFVTKSGNQQLYTRAGSFDFDGTGRLVTPDGNLLQGWMATNGAVNTNGPIGDLSVPFGQSLKPVASSAGEVTGNLNSATAATTPVVPVVTQQTMYDPLGAAHQITYTFTPTATPNQWTVSVASGATALTTTPAAVTVNFDPTASATSGKIIPAAAQKFTFDASAINAAWTGPVSADLSQMTQYGAPTTAIANSPVNGGGSAQGTLESFSLGNDGSITGVYSNGLRQVIGQLALANFANPSGLTKAGNSSYVVGDNSGTARIGVAGTGGRGSLTAGALEMSNVDLAQEFTGLIIAQRGFQANSKVITTSDQILQDLVQMKQ
ncbi:MAG: flagellar hook protein FlgE [Blastococcus sp.]|nr:flagellar hook protein FlgE [Blastococcus sp.]